MNRKILFKAKRKDWRDLPKEQWWVEGLLMKMWGTLHIQDSEDESTDYEIDIETLCQYTGLTDKNGKKIWENDICDTFENDSKEILRNVVKFEDGCFKVFKEHYLPMHLDCYEESDLKVKGNIFDNPELLEVE